MTESEVDPDPEEAVAGPVDDGDETDDSGTGDIGEDVSAEFFVVVKMLTALFARGLSSFYVTLDVFKFSAENVAT